MKNLIYLYVFFIALTIQAQVEAPPTVPNDKNWTSSINYDFSGNTISKGINYFNDIGKGTQQQTWDVLTNRIWTSEVRYDYFNRPVLQTLSAPINNSSLFGYKSDFIKSNSLPLTLAQYDSSTTVNNPPTISPDTNTLGWYYSTQNNLDPYQDITSYPYTRSVYSELNPGTASAIYGGNKINGQWMQSYSFNMPMETNTTAATLTQFVGKKIMKSISRGVDGIETVVFTDINGNMIAAARSGNEQSGTAIVRSVYSTIIDKGFVDIHIPVGCGGTITLSDVNANHNIRVFNLLTEAIINTNVTTSVVLTPGFYRFEDMNNYYGKNNSITTPIVPVKINYTVNYYDYSLNEYDLAGRLLKSIQPLGSQTSTPLQSTFVYNTFNQLLSTTSPDEGTANFKYRKDGQIRFSQNNEQAKINAFSYTNYDNLGRPVESGVYQGLDIVFSDPNNDNSAPLVDTIIDELDGLPTDGRTEQNFSVYDVTDAEFQEKVTNCGLSTQDYKQTFISGNVSYTYTQNPTTNKTWYSYDVFGRVKWVSQEIPDLGCFKTIDYVYNPINGQTVKIDYQRNVKEERFIHKYDYNIAGQLTDVYTSLDEYTYNREAHYKYNESGALVRTELADNLQGIDYVYNLAGQLKAINHPELTPSLDPGNDGASGSGFATDVFGMAVDYYNGDYARTGTPKPVTSSSSGTDQFDGNIKATRWNTQVAGVQNAYMYEYNKNKWLSEANFGTATTAGVISLNSNSDYKVSRIEYDANGNIQSLVRNGYTDASGTNSMDSFFYRYSPQGSSAVSNRLLSVKDAGDNTDANRYNDLKNQEIVALTGGVVLGNPQTTTLDNYAYNDLGQMVLNLQDKTLYDYNASGLVTKISTFTNQPVGFKTVYFNNYSNFTSTNYGWSRVGSSSLHTFDPGFPFEMTDLCPDLTDLPVYGGNVMQISGIIAARKQFRVTPNTTFKLDFDLILDKILNEATSTAIAPKVVINLLKPDGTIFYTQTVNSQTAEYCNRYFDTHISQQFTATTEYFSLELVISNDLPVNTANNSKSKYQYTFVDNLHLQAATAAKVVFYYNDRGQRVMKESYLPGDTKSTTYYVRDVSGNVMGVYQGVTGPLVRYGEPALIENSVFGSGRIGVYKREDGDGYTLYELTDHLGNVRAVIRKVGTALFSLTNKTDYYPFGMPMPNKQITDNNYRYNFQGQEKDGETGMEAFELRLWDGRLGRWLTVDPYNEFHSPYLGMGNNPISLTDADGGSTESPDDWYKNLATGEVKWFNNTADGFSDLNGGSWSNTGYGNELLEFNGSMFSYSFQTRTGKSVNDLKLTTYDYSADSGVSVNQKKLSVMDKLNMTSSQITSRNIFSQFDYSKGRQKEKSTGPIPEGNYYILKDKIQEFDELSTFQQALGTVGRGQWRGALYAWGNYRFEIYPKKVNIGNVSRGDFFVHGGSVRGSAGCIDLCSGIGAFVHYFKQHSQNKVHLIVKY